MRKDVLTAILAIMVLSTVFSGCGKKEIEESPTTVEKTEETGHKSDAENSDGKLTAHQQELADKVYQQLVDEDYDAVIRNMDLPENAVLTADNINNLYAAMMDFKQTSKKSKMNEKFQNGCIMFDYGYEGGESWTVGILEDRDTPDGYKVILQGLNSGHLQEEYEETHLILPSGLTDVKVNGVSIDRFADDTYFNDAEDPKYDVSSYTAYRVVFPLYRFTDYDISLRKNSDEFRNYNLVVTAQSPFGEVKGLANDNNSEIQLHIGDSSADMCYTQDSEEVKKMLAELLQGVFDCVSAGDFDIESYRGFFAEGTDDQVITEQIESLVEVAVAVTDEDTHIKNIDVGEITIHEDDGTIGSPKTYYAGQGKINVSADISVSYDDTLTFDGNLNHRDCRQSITCQVKGEENRLKFVRFSDENSLAYLLNWL